MTDHPPSLIKGLLGAPFCKWAMMRSEIRRGERGRCGLPHGTLSRESQLYAFGSGWTAESSPGLGMRSVWSQEATTSCF